MRLIAWLTPIDCMTQAMFSKEHTSSQYDLELNALMSNVLEMGYLVENQFRLSMAAFTSGEPESKNQLENDRAAIDTLKLTIDASCDLLLVKRQPTAVDMRTVVAIIRIANELERLGEHARKIMLAAHKPRTEELGQQSHNRELNRTARIVLQMVRSALDAFEHGDAEVAHQLDQIDNEVNLEYHSTIRSLIGLMMENPKLVSSAVEIMSAAKSVERIGDHAKNVAHLVKYMVNGRGMPPE